MAKAEAQWIIPSTLKSRVHSEQRQSGQFFCLWADVDETDGLTFDEIVNRTSDVIPSDFIAYTSKSATEEKQKSRIGIPLLYPISGTDFITCQTILNDKLEAAGIIPDRATERPGQVCYLPNRGKFYKSALCNSKGDFNPDTWKAEKVKIEQDRKAAQEALKARQEAAKQKARQRIAKGTHDPIVAYNAEYPLPLVLESYGYLQRGKRWLSPNSSSGVHGVTITDDGQKWISAHQSDSGIGIPTSNGSMGDAFDLFKYYEHGNDTAAALKAAGEMFMVNGVTLDRANQRDHMRNQGRVETYSEQTQEKDDNDTKRKEQPPLIDISARVRQYLLDEFNGGVFKLSDLKRELTLSDKQYTVARNCIRRMVSGGEVEKHGHALGCYRVVDAKKNCIDWDQTEARPSRLELPAGLHEVATIREGDMITIAGYKNHAKSAFAIETVKLNLDRFKVHFFITEYRARMKQRLIDFGVDLHHKNLFAYQIEKSDYIPDKIESGEGVLNVIDHLPNLDNFYLVGKIQDEIHTTIEWRPLRHYAPKEKPE